MKKVFKYIRHRLDKSALVIYIFIVRNIAVMFYRLYILQIDMVDVDFFDTFYYQEQCKIGGNVESSVLESINNDANENKIRDEASTKILHLAK